MPALSPAALRQAIETDGGQLLHDRVNHRKGFRVIRVDAPVQDIEVEHSPSDMSVIDEGNSADALLPLDVIEEVLGAARKAGATFADLRYTHGAGTSILVQDGRADKIGTGRSRGAGVRVLVEIAPKAGIASRRVPRGFQRRLEIDGDDGSPLGTALGLALRAIPEGAAGAVTATLIGDALVTGPRLIGPQLTVPKTSRQTQPSPPALCRTVSGGNS